MAEHKDFHIYKGKKYWSVTTLLSIINNEQWNRMRGAIGNQSADERLQYGSDVGQEFHKYCAMIARKKSFDIPVLTEPLNSMVAQVQKWFDENIKKVIAVEKRYFHSTYLYCGTVDLVAELKSGGVFIVDYKSGAKIGQKEMYQLSAYIKSYINDIDGCIILHVPKKGKLKPITSANIKINHYFYMFLLAKQLYLDINEK